MEAASDSEGSMMAAAAAAAATDSLSGGGGASAPIIPERLQQREAERRGEAERRRKEREAQSVEEERSEFFAAAFSRQKEAAEALLGPGLGSEAVSEAAALLQELQRLLTDSVRFLAPYEVRQAQAALTRLQGALAQRRLDVQPKKRFAFTKALKKEASGKPSEATKEEGTEGPPSILPSEPLCGFSQEEGKALELGQEELLQKDVVLSGLSCCRVRLKGNPNTLLLRDCQDCTLLCGPVSTSARVDGCQRCLVALACQQLRTRRTSDTSFYVQVTSRAMLEECRGIRFAPYTWSYRGQEQDFETSRLDRSQGHWDRVDDFDWLARDQASPNWSLLPEKERVVDWD
ncbi:tubulin-specific chaperone C [Sceloporus undulatus]|uniref:tubulin-specific chaperone C n=1 Tax=Sceloporus undulatus TaxID=8520 RepID=UPI001C4BD9EC|nr:tubulin-specific chaperone C [Sceloporus undulatus]